MNFSPLTLDTCIITLDGIPEIQKMGNVLQFAYRNSPLLSVNPSVNTQVEDATNISYMNLMHFIAEMLINYQHKEAENESN